MNMPGVRSLNSKFRTDLSVHHLPQALVDPEHGETSGLGTQEFYHFQSWQYQLGHGLTSLREWLGPG